MQGSTATHGIRTDFDPKGCARIDHLNDLVLDLANLGLDTTPLLSGAENCIRMWERTNQINRQVLPGVGIFRTVAVAPMSPTSSAR
ncbi:MAG TPA: hypothetical protein VIH59_26285 [Candidatus Tectomicrobia bacterium]|jgi:hypothetical protein